MEEKEQKEEKKEYQYAGFWIRFLALLIDGIILGILQRAIFGFPKETISTDPTAANLFGIIYTIGFWLAISATPGKWLLKLKIIKTDGSRLAPGTAILRYLGYIVSAIPLTLGFIWAGFDSKKQGWHDKIAQTYVIRQ